MTCLKGLFYYCYAAHDLPTVAHCLPKEDDSPAYFLKETVKHKVRLWTRTLRTVTTKGKLLSPEVLTLPKTNAAYAQNDPPVTCKGRYHFKGTRLTAVNVLNFPFMPKILQSAPLGNSKGCFLCNWTIKRVCELSENDVVRGGVCRYCHTPVSKYVSFKSTSSLISTSVTTFLSMLFSFPSLVDERQTNPTKVTFLIH